MPSSTVDMIREPHRLLRETLRHLHLTVEADSLLVTIQSKWRQMVSGWYHPMAWTGSGGKRFAEINPCAEHLTTHHAGRILLHELAHAENTWLGIRQCCRGLHNRKYSAMAERLGLVVAPRDQNRGFGHTGLRPTAVRVGFQPPAPPASMPRSWVFACGVTVSPEGGV